MIWIVAATRTEFSTPLPGTRVVHTGIGPHRVAPSLDAAAAQGAPDAIVATGFAGGLDSALQTGTPVLDRTLSDPAWAAAAIAGIPGIVDTRFLSVTEPLGDPDAKRAAFTETGCGAVDMESQAVRAWSERRGIAVLHLRVILDPASMSVPFPAAPLCDPATGHPSALRTMAWLMRHPAKLPALLHFARLARATSSTLAAVMIAAVRCHARMDGRL